MSLGPAFNRRPALTKFVTFPKEIVETRAGEVIYQVYPSSFADADGDGCGDLRGITSKLDYIQQLGVDSIWISPFYASPEGPEGDGGYAVSDYKGIAERFGTAEDFQELLDAAHARGLRVYIDFVMCHTAHDHEWFEKSRNREEPYADYYVWNGGWKVDAGSDTPPADWRENAEGIGWSYNKDEQKWYRHYPPNNWKSVFGGIAWQWDEKREEFYLHHFLKSQPALNLNTSKVQDAIMEDMKYWLDMGVDGFRYDAIPFANYDPQLRHNPWMDGKWPRATEGWGEQRFAHSACQPQTVELAARFRELMDSYPEKRTTLGEAVCGPDGGGGCIPVAASYVQDKTGLDMCYTDAFTHIWSYPDKNTMRDKITYLLDTFPMTGGHCNSIDNHDTARSASRITNGVDEVGKQQVLRQMMQMFICLPGSFSMYQGQELGLSQARIPEDIPHDKQRDPTAVTLGSGRDGCRTPLPWSGHQQNAGFSTSDAPYLPVPNGHYNLSIDRQVSQPDPFLNFTRELLAWRKLQPALVKGQTFVIDNPGDVLGMVRISHEQAMLCLFNMSAHEQSFTPSAHIDPALLEKMNLKPGETVKISPYGTAFYGANPLPSPVQKPKTKASGPKCS